jgi:hypothetical protein
VLLGGAATARIHGGAHGYSRTHTTSLGGGVRRPSAPECHDLGTPDTVSGKAGNRERFERAPCRRRVRCVLNAKRRYRPLAARRTEQRPANNNTVPVNAAVWLDTAGVGLRVTQMGEGVAGWQNPLAQSALKSQFWPSAAKHVPLGLQARNSNSKQGGVFGILQHGPLRKPQRATSPASATGAPASRSTSSTANPIRFMAAFIIPKCSIYQEKYGPIADSVHN